MPPTTRNVLVGIAEAIVITAIILGVKMLVDSPSGKENAAEAKQVEYRAETVAPSERENTDKDIAVADSTDTSAKRRSSDSEGKRESARKRRKSVASKSSARRAAKPAPKPRDFLRDTIPTGR